MLSTDYLSRPINTMFTLASNPWLWTRWRVSSHVCPSSTGSSGSIFPRTGRLRFGSRLRPRCAGPSGPTGRLQEHPRCGRCHRGNASVRVRCDMCGIAGTLLSKRLAG